MYTRETFERQRTMAKQRTSREGRVVAFVSVGLGLAQLIFIRWADAHIEGKSAVAIEGGIFLAYVALIAFLIWRMERRLRGIRPACPQCGVSLKGMSERVAAATGRCDGCGGQVFE
jgi:hypothetical protein